MSSTNHLPWRFAGNHNKSNTLAGSATAKRTQQEGRNRAAATPFRFPVFFARRRGKRERRDHRVSAWAVGVVRIVAASLIPILRPRRQAGIRKDCRDGGRRRQGELGVVYAVRRSPYPPPI